MAKQPVQTYFVTGIGTDVGKTVASAILVDALKADYFKLIQAGDEEQDRNTVKSLIRSDAEIFPAGVLLKAPMSPHAAADLENKYIKSEDLKLPKTTKSLIIEGAGGLMVPINDTETLLDWLKTQKNLEVIVVSKNYLGSINHSLLTLEVLHYHNIKIKGIIFNGEPNQASEHRILDQFGDHYLGRILPEKELNSSALKPYVEYFKKQF
ncbi:MAG: dethiobiotin synthase [Flavobacteriales bacterium]